jgi:hypothetical protein
LVPQHGRVGDRLTSVGEHHGQIERDPTRAMAATTLPKHRHGLTQLPRQAGRVSDIGEQPAADMTGDTPTIRADNDPRTWPGNLHLAGALRAGADEASTTVVFPAWKALPRLRPADRSALVRSRG